MDTISSESDSSPSSKSSLSSNGDKKKQKVRKIKQQNFGTQAKNIFPEKKKGKKSTIKESKRDQNQAKVQRTNQSNNQINLIIILLNIFHQKIMY